MHHTHHILYFPQITNWAGLIEKPYKIINNYNKFINTNVYFMFFL